MGKLISLSVTLGLMAISSGNLPWVLKKIRVAQIKLIQDSQASKWPKAMTRRANKKSPEIF
jgi:hypothetical protein